MYQNINVHDFRDAFKAIGRVDQFTHKGLGALFEFLEDMERDTGERTELDVIALCRDFSEHESLEAVAKECGIEPGDLDHYTIVIEVNGGGVIIKNF